MLGPNFDLRPPRASRGQTRWGIFAPSKRIFKSVPTTLKRGSRATGKTRVLFSTKTSAFLASFHRF